MTTPTSERDTTQPLSTADLAAASRHSKRVTRDPHEAEEGEIEPSAYDRDEREREPQQRTAGEPDAESLDPLFAADEAQDYRNRWIAIQGSFVDDPSGAVRAGDELVAQVMSELANSFANQRHRFESQLGASGPGNTEDLRVALRSYRSFFERLLSL
jgi:hypothetical protein